MNLTLKFRAELAKVSHYLVEEFDQLLTALNVAWEEQHTDEDAHGAVTAESVASAAGYTERDRAVPVGEWTAVPHDAANFIGLGGMTWTPPAEGSYTYRYMLVGKTLFLRFTQTGNGTLGGSAYSMLQLKLPAGLLAAQTGYGPGVVVDGGSWQSAIWQTNVGSDRLSLYKMAMNNYTLGANQLHLELTIEVQ